MFIFWALRSTWPAGSPVLDKEQRDQALRYADYENERDTALLCDSGLPDTEVSKEAQANCVPVLHLLLRRLPADACSSTECMAVHPLHTRLMCSGAAYPASMCMPPHVPSGTS